jgi:hypoxanthine phosphoribosyltransferase
MTSKEFITPDRLFRDSFALAKKIHDSGYRPDFLLVLWRGGAPVGLVIHEFLGYKGIKIRHMVVRAESYTGMATRTEPVVENIEAVLKVLGGDTKVLIVDDIFDSGGTVRKIRELLLPRTVNVRVATLYCRKGAKAGPDYYLREVSGWLVFPHEIAGLSLDEILQKDAYIHSLLS